MLQSWADVQDDDDDDHIISSTSMGGTTSHRSQQQGSASFVENQHHPHHHHSGTSFQKSQAPHQSGTSLSKTFGQLHTEADMARSWRRTSNPPPPPFLSGRKTSASSQKNLPALAGKRDTTIAQTPASQHTIPPNATVGTLATLKDHYGFFHVPGRSQGVYFHFKELVRANYGRGIDPSTLTIGLPFQFMLTVDRRTERVHATHIVALDPVLFKEIAPVIAKDVEGVIAKEIGTGMGSNTRQYQQTGRVKISASLLAANKTTDRGNNKDDDGENNKQDIVLMYTLSDVNDEYGRLLMTGDRVLIDVTLHLPTQKKYAGNVRLVRPCHDGREIGVVAVCSSPEYGFLRCLDRSSENLFFHINQIIPEQPAVVTNDSSDSSRSSSTNKTGKNTKKSKKHCTVSVKEGDIFEFTYTHDEHTGKSSASRLCRVSADSFQWEVISKERYRGRISRPFSFHPTRELSKRMIHSLIAAPDAASSDQNKGKTSKRDGTPKKTKGGYSFKHADRVLPLGSLPPNHKGVILWKNTTVAAQQESPKKHHMVEPLEFSVEDILFAVPPSLRSSDTIEDVQVDEGTSFTSVRMLSRSKRRLLALPSEGSHSKNTKSPFVKLKFHGMDGQVGYCRFVKYDEVEFQVAFNRMTRQRYATNIALVSPTMDHRQQGVVRKLHTAHGYGTIAAMDREDEFSFELHDVVVSDGDQQGNSLAVGQAVEFDVIQRSETSHGSSSSKGGRHQKHEKIEGSGQQQAVRVCRIPQETAFMDIIETRRYFGVVFKTILTSPGVRDQLKAGKHPKMRSDVEPWDTKALENLPFGWVRLFPEYSSMEEFLAAGKDVNANLKKKGKLAPFYLDDLATGCFPGGDNTTGAGEECRKWKKNVIRSKEQLLALHRGLEEGDIVDCFLRIHRRNQKESATCIRLRKFHASDRYRGVVVTLKPSRSSHGNASSGSKNSTPRSSSSSGAKMTAVIRGLGLPCRDRNVEFHGVDMPGAVHDSDYYLLQSSGGSLADDDESSGVIRKGKGKDLALSRGDCVEFSLRRIHHHHHHHRGGGYSTPGMAHDYQVYRVVKLPADSVSLMHIDDHQLLYGRFSFRDIKLPEELLALGLVPPVVSSHRSSSSFLYRRVAVVSRLSEEDATQIAAEGRQTVAELLGPIADNNTKQSDNGVKEEKEQVSERSTTTMEEPLKGDDSDNKKKGKKKKSRKGSKITSENTATTTNKKQSSRKEVMEWIGANRCEYGFEIPLHLSTEYSMNVLLRPGDLVSFRVAKDRDLPTPFVRSKHMQTFPCHATNVGIVPIMGTIISMPSSSSRGRRDMGKIKVELQVPSPASCVAGMVDNEDTTSNKQKKKHRKKKGKEDSNHTQQKQAATLTRIKEIVYFHPKDVGLSKGSRLCLGDRVLIKSLARHQFHHHHHSSNSHKSRPDDRIALVLEKVPRKALFRLAKGPDGTTGFQFSRTV